MLFLSGSFLFIVVLTVYLYYLSLLLPLLSIIKKNRYLVRTARFWNNMHKCPKTECVLCTIHWFWKKDFDTISWKNLIKATYLLSFWGLISEVDRYFFNNILSTGWATPFLMLIVEFDRDIQYFLVSFVYWNFVHSN